MASEMLLSSSTAHGSHCGDQGGPLFRALFSCCGTSTAAGLKGGSREDLDIVIDVDCGDFEDKLVQDFAPSTASGSDDIHSLSSPLSSEELAEEEEQEAGEVGHQDVADGSAVSKVSSGTPAATTVAALEQEELDIAAPEARQEQEQGAIALDALEETTSSADAEGEEPHPNFSGRWVLEELEGDFEAWLQDMGQPFWIRISAKHLKYGLGKVVVRCEQSGDQFFFGKILADPRQLFEAKASFGLGERVEFKDEIGKVTAQTSRWEGRTLAFDAKAAETKLSLQLRMYFDEHGRFVEEMVSCKGKSIKYFFRNSA